MFTQPARSTQITNIYQILRIDGYATTPKYQQLVNAIIQGIEEGFITKDDVLPSINDLSYELDISRDTGVRAYKVLKNMGLIASVAGKGYHIATTTIEKGIKVCLLFNKLSTHKKIIYDSFCKALGWGGAIDFYIYNNDFAVFKELLKSKEKQYDYYVIIPHFVEGGEQAGQLIDSIPKNRLIMMDKLLPGQESACGAVFEDFERDIYQALEAAIDPLRKYHQIKIIFPPHTYHPQEILAGFERFCIEFGFVSGVIRDIVGEVIEPGTAYISLMEDDLVILVEKIIDGGYRMGIDAGVISYNETPLKKIISNGITTISTDFRMMGEKAAALILTNSKEQIAIPFSLMLRGSL